MNTKFNVKWSLDVKIITAVCVVMLIFAEIELVKSVISEQRLGVFFAIALILFAFLFVLQELPVAIYLDDKKLVLKKVFGKKIIYFNNIAHIQPFKFSFFDIRIFGSGGFGGFLGYFSNRQIGRYRAYICNKQQAFVIHTKTEKNYAFSCENYEKLIKIINNQIDKQ